MTTASTIDVPTVLRQRVIGVATELGLERLAQVASEPRNCFDEITAEVLLLPPDARDRFAQQAMDGFFPNAPVLLNWWVRFVALSPYDSAPDQDVGDAVRSYSESLNRPETAVYVVDALEGLMAGVKTKRLLSSSFEAQQALLKNLMETSETVGVQGYVVSFMKTALVKAGTIGQEIINREGLSLDIGNAVHRQLFQTVQGIVASIMVDNEEHPTFSTLMGIFDQGVLPLGVDQDAFVVYRLAR